MDAAIVTGVVRHILTAAGGALVAKYGVDGASVDAIVGGLAALIGVGWSIWEKKKGDNDGVR